MANLQYIGARYVPKFYENSLDPTLCDWESGVSYEPLTVVTYNDDSYTSKKLVPSNIGNPAANPDYWVKTGDFNASLVALQNAVSLLRNDVDTMDGEVDALQATESNGLSMITDYLFTKNLYVDDISGDGKKIVQGSAYNSVTNTILTSFINSGDTSCTLVLLDSDGETVLNRATFSNLGHCNDITYNPNTRRYYVCNAKTTDTVNTIAIIKEDLTLDSIITLAGSEVAGCIAYDEDNDRYVVVTGGTVQIYDNVFNLTEEFAFDFKHAIQDDNSGWTLLNAANFYKGELYIGAVKGNFGGLGAGLSGSIVMNFDLVSKKIKRSNVVVIGTSVTELEGLFTMGDNMYAIGGGNVYFFMARLVMQDMPYLEIGNNVLYAGVELDAGTDLDKVITAGKYFVNASNISSVANMPFNANAFATLFVLSAGPSGLIQIVNRLDAYPCFYFRIIATSGVASAWHNIGYIAHGGGEVKLQNYVVPAFVSGGGKEFYICLPFGDCSDLTVSAIQSLSFTITARANGNYLSDGVNNNVIKSANANILETYKTKQGLRVKLKRSDDAAFISGQNNYEAVCELDATMIP